MIACLSPNGQNQTEGVEPVDKLFVGTLRGVHALLRDASGEWRAEARGLEDRHISSLLYDEGSGLMFAGIHGRGEEGGIFVSEDEGRSWTPRFSGIDKTHVYSLASEQRDGETILYAGVEPPALYRSRDLGESWEELSALNKVPGTEKWTFPPPPHIAHVKCMTLNPAEPGCIYALVEQGALLKSEDDGKSWRELDAYASEDDSFYRDVHRVAVARSDKNRIHLSTGDGLYYTEDGGKTWEHQQKRTDRVGYPDPLFLDPRDDDTVYLGGAGDAPETWRVEGGAFPGFIVSHDRGRTWAEQMNGLPDPIEGNIEAMAMHSSPKGLAFYAGTAVGEVFGTEDGGENWARIASGLPPVSKARHYRHFLSAEEKKRIEEEAKAERRAEGLADKEYKTNA
ncbi:WD40/YVTN/BNR-like repeat-containing protein [Hyphococcus luteus]|uniref:WD40/YVTN/BNR-like repeat-containing protein n=1 Tax=Hyphococcus luteus TaxID=2058213 RepID=UPI000D529B72|nr:glycosyl hydrolase [Marinicaulis flavus]